MAVKRALVSAVMIGCRVGGMFAQDLEDAVDEELLGKADDTRSWERAGDDGVSVGTPAKTVLEVWSDKLRAAAADGKLDTVAAQIKPAFAKGDITAEDRDALVTLYKSLKPKPVVDAPAAKPSEPKPVAARPEAGEVAPEDEPPPSGRQPGDD
jgi:hypothetical protein